MELCIKTKGTIWNMVQKRSFNPCFNGTMYKNGDWDFEIFEVELFQSLF